VTLRYWQPIIIPGLFQTAEYARALLLAAQTDTLTERRALVRKAAVAFERVRGLSRRGANWRRPPMPAPAGGGQ